MIDSVSSDDQLHERLDEGRLGHETKKAAGSVPVAQGRGWTDV